MNTISARMELWQIRDNNQLNKGNQERKGEQMRPGNLSQTVWRRSVSNQLKEESDKALISFSPCEACSGIQGEDQELVMAEATLCDASEQVAVYAIMKAVQDLVTRGAEVQDVCVTYTFPTSVKESVVIRMMDAVQKFCKEQKLTLSGVKAQVQPGVILHVAHVVATGKVLHRTLLEGLSATPGQEVILCGSLALEGMERIVDTSEKELGQRFIPTFLYQMKALKEELYQPETIRGAWAYVTAMRQIGSGGIFGQLWSLADEAKVGFSLELSQMTLCQETIEVCEFYRLNPYQMTSTGAILMITDRGEELLQYLHATGCRATRLGLLEEGNTKIVCNGTEIRYVDRPAPDELSLWQEERLEK